MFACFKFHLLQIWRSRLLLMWVLFSLFAQYSAVRLLHVATVHYQAQGVAENISFGASEIVMALLYVQFATGGLLAMIYGIWVVPYLHEESRAPLTFALPVSKWVFPAVYALSFLLLYILQGFAMFASLTTQFGISVWAGPGFPWGNLGSATVMSVLALEVSFFILAVVSLYFGRIAALIGGTTVLLILQVSGAVFRALGTKEGLWGKIYPFLPPLGETFIDLKNPNAFSGETAQHLILFVVWLVALASVFRMRLNRA